MSKPEYHTIFSNFFRNWTNNRVMALVAYPEDAPLFSTERNKLERSVEYWEEADGELLDFPLAYLEQAPLILSTDNGETGFQLQVSEGRLIISKYVGG